MTFVTNAPPVWCGARQRPRCSALDGLVPARVPGRAVGVDAVPVQGHGVFHPLVDLGHLLGAFTHGRGLGVGGDLRAKLQHVGLRQGAQQKFGQFLRQLDPTTDAYKINVFRRAI